MSLGYRVAIPVVLMILLTNTVAAADKRSDRWFARDKFEHFALSTFYAAGTAKIARRHFDMGKGESIAVGFGFTISLGIGKEAADSYSHKGTASLKDLIWDLAGAVSGSIIAGLAL